MHLSLSLSLSLSLFWALHVTSSKNNCATQFTIFFCFLGPNLAILGMIIMSLTHPLSQGLDLTTTESLR
jgi:F0F1-type ATP synthase membrane subunit a